MEEQVFSVEIRLQTPCFAEPARTVNKYAEMEN